jgi:hypothetical protein
LEWFKDEGWNYSFYCVYGCSSYLQHYTIVHGTSGI